MANQGPRPACVACGEKKANRPRGLCWTCYYRAGVKEAVPRRKFGNHQPDIYGGYGLGEPTAALPGSHEKVEVMMERAEKNLSLFHPDDATGFAEGEDGVGEGRHRGLPNQRGVKNIFR